MDNSVNDSKNDGTASPVLPVWLFVYKKK